MKIRGVPSRMADTCDPGAQEAGAGPKLKGAGKWPSSQGACYQACCPESNTQAHTVEEEEQLLQRREPALSECPLT